MALIELVRHAQASFGSAHYDRLSELGRQQSRWLGAYFAARGLVFGPAELDDVFAFPLHAEAARRYFASHDVRGSHAYADV